MPANRKPLFSGENSELLTLYDAHGTYKGGYNVTTGCVEFEGKVYEPQRTGSIEIVKSGPLCTVYRHTCCGWEYEEYKSDRFDMPDDYCPKCGALLK